MLIQCSLSLSHTHTQRQWKSWLSFSIVWRVTLNIYTAWQRLCPGIWVAVSCELPLRRDGAPLVAVNMSRVYLCNQPSGVKPSSLSITQNYTLCLLNSYLWLNKHSWYTVVSVLSLSNVGPGLSSPDKGTIRLPELAVVSQTMCQHRDMNFCINALLATY